MSDGVLKPAAKPLLEKLHLFPAQELSSRLDVLADTIRFWSENDTADENYKEKRLKELVKESTAIQNELRKRGLL